MLRKSLRRVVLGVLAAALLTLAPTAQARTTRASDTLTLYVNFDYSGNITVTLPSGAPVGTKSGANPTVIPAGYYTVELSQPGCVDVPTFILQGPGVDLENDLESGEIVTDAAGIVLQANSTYTWRSGSVNPPTYFTFETNGQVTGTPPPPTNNATAPLSKNKETNQDLVGSAAKTLQGTLTGAVSATGHLGLSFKSKSVSTLKAGKYQLKVDDSSSHNGLTLTSTTHRTMKITSSAFVGKRSVAIVLTVGKWFATTGSGGKKTFAVVK